MKCSPETPGWNSASVVTVNDLPGDRWHRQLTINCHYCSIVSTEQICDCCITWIRLIVWVIPYCMTKATRQLVWCLWLFSPQDQQCQTPVTRSGDSVWCLYLLLRSTNFMQSGLYVYTFLVCSVLCDKLTVSHLVVRFRSDCQYGPQLALLQTKWCALG